MKTVSGEDENMRLGIVMTGSGALAAAGVGVLQVLEDRGITPYAVCGLEAGAWPAALYISGRDVRSIRAAMLQAACVGRRFFSGAAGAGALLRKKRRGMIRARKIERLLVAQAGQRMMCICPKPGMLMCRTLLTGRHVIFTSRAFEHDAASLVSMQASVSFASRAALTLPPFLEPVQWMGTPLVADTETGFACTQLTAMGAQRVMVIRPEISAQHVPDVLDLSCMTFGIKEKQALPPNAISLNLPMPPQTGALSVDQIAQIMRFGEEGARQQMDIVMARLGMAYCRVLPFTRGYAHHDA
ncbi:MAG: hypothetical protein IJ381_07750 [Clostridia bacterium]|nr:hypothetical protein [Clostridia bacterium]